MPSPPHQNDWTKKKEKLLKYWQEECRLYNWLYTTNIQHYQNLNKVLSVVSILLSAITGATLLNNTETTNYIIILAFGIISILSAFLQGVLQFLDLDTKISINTYSARQNSAIVIDIEEQLNLTRQERNNGSEFIKNIKSRKNDIIQNGPIISKKVWDRLKYKIKHGEGISFFNESTFKSYLENTIELEDLNLRTDENPGDIEEGIVRDGSVSDDEFVDMIREENISKQQLKYALCSHTAPSGTGATPSGTGATPSGLAMLERLKTGLSRA